VSRHGRAKGKWCFGHELIDRIPSKTRNNVVEVFKIREGGIPMIKFVIRLHACVVPRCAELDVKTKYRV